MERPVEAPQRLSRGPSGEVVVAVDAESQARSGIQAAPLRAFTAPRELKAHGRVLEPGALVSLASDLALAEAALPAAQAEFERARALQEGQGLAPRAVEIAQAQLRAAEARARALGRRIRDEWGSWVADLAPQDREEFLDRLVNRDAAMAWVHLPASETSPAKPVRAELTLPGLDDTRIAAEQVLEAARVDEALQGKSFLLRIESPPAAILPGAAVTAHLYLSGEPLKGVLLPRSAVVRHEGRAWVYVERGCDHFSRKEVLLERPLEDGWFLAGDLRDGGRVVLAGAQMLLSEELRARIRLAEEEE